LITLGVPVAAWSAIFVADVLLRKSGYHEESLYSPQGNYGSINWASLAILAISTVIGFGYVQSSTPSWLEWEGYFLGSLGGKTGVWGSSNVGVIFALVSAFVFYLVYGLSKKEK
jgi:lysylphosphatidylglycerol synthetase-like protein (DUF2156 family)